jgi:hypothetical protein
VTLTDPTVARSAELIVAGLTVHLLDVPGAGYEPVDVLIEGADDDGRIPGVHEAATYLAAVDLLALIVSHASYVLAVDLPELTGRLGQIVARHRETHR